MQGRHGGNMGDEGDLRYHAFTIGKLVTMGQ